MKNLQQDSDNLFVVSFVIFLAVGLQILNTIIIGNTSIRFCFADVLLPIVFIIWLYFMMRTPFEWPQFIVTGLVPWLAVLSFWLIFSIFNGWIRMNVLSTWALYGKGVGWFILLTYFLSGVIIKSHVSKKTITIFFQAFVLFSTLSCMLSYIYFILYKSGVQLDWGVIQNYDRLRGFAQNTNAFAIMAAISFLIFLMLDTSNKLSKRYLNIAIGGVLLSAVIFSGSRSAVLALLAGIIGLLLLRSIALRQLILFTLAGILIILAVLCLAQLGDYLYIEGIGGGGKAAYILNVPLIERQSFNHRITNIDIALDLWREAPFLGSGIGSFLEKTYKLNPHNPSTLHNTALWILTEMGAIGLIIFAGCYVFIMVRVFYCIKTPSISKDASMLFVVLVAFSAASMGTEILYQRYLWFVSGILIALPRFNYKYEP